MKRTGRQSSHQAPHHRAPGNTPGRISLQPLTTGIIATALAIALGLGITIIAQSPAGAAEETFFPDSSVPAVAVDPDRSSVELGLKFSVTTPGTVIGVRYYGTAENTGTHTGSLWSSRGSRLTTATFPSSDGNGWQSVAFDEPVPVVPGRTYIASYLAPAGRYAADEGAFTRGVERGHITVPRNGGVYFYGRDGGFPRYTWHSSNYYVDVRFVPTTTGTPTASPPITTEPTGTPTDPTETAEPTGSPTASEGSPGTSTPTPTPSASPDPTESPTSTPSETPTASPTPSPTPPPTTGTGCVADPGSCGFPDASSTGTEAGAALKDVPGDVRSGPGWHYDPRGWVQIDGAGATFSGFHVTTNVDVTAPNVTIENSVIDVDAGWGVSLRNADGVTIDHNTIGGSSTSDTCDNAIRDIYGDSDRVTITYNDIAYCASGLNHFNNGGLVAHNFIHDIGYPCSGSNCDHFNGIQLEAGHGTPMTIDHNTILVPYSQTDCIMLANSDGSQTNRIITNNLLAGGGYTFYGDGGPDGITTNIVFRDNRFSTAYFPNGGYWGPVAYWKSGSGNSWSGNTWIDGPRAGASVNP